MIQEVTDILINEINRRYNPQTRRVQPFPSMPTLETQLTALKNGGGNLTITLQMFQEVYFNVLAFMHKNSEAIYITCDVLCEFMRKLSALPIPNDSDCDRVSSMLCSLPGYLGLEEEASSWIRSLPSGEQKKFALKTIKNLIHHENYTFPSYVMSRTLDDLHSFTMDDDDRAEISRCWGQCVLEDEVLERYWLFTAIAYCAKHDYPSYLSQEMPLAIFSPRQNGGLVSVWLDDIYEPANTLEGVYFDDILTSYEPDWNFYVQKWQARKKLCLGAIPMVTREEGALFL